MAIGFNADEVFEMAVRIEENGAAFYLKAADLNPDPKNRKFLENLAAMEKGHKKVFSEMRKTLVDKEKAGKIFDPNDELSLYLASLADSIGGEGSPAAADALTGSESLAEILNIAIGLEKDSILFYLGLKDMVPEKQGRGRIDDIIKQERQHVAQLKSVLSKMDTK